MDVLEYIVQLRGAQLAAAQVKEVSGSFDALAASEKRAGVAGAEMAAGTSKGARALTALSMVGKAGALALVGIGVEAVKMSAQFNHEMLKIRTDAGASTQELAKMKTGVLELAASGASMGAGPMSLAQGLYHLESLGIRGARALYALKLASQEAAISGASLEDTTNALGAAMFVGIKGTGNLQHLMGILNATVGAGNMRFQQLTEALGTGVLSSAKNAGLSLQDVSAALAVATDSGMAASSAGAQLATAFHFLYAPGLKATNALNSIGLAQNTLGRDMGKPQGLLRALTDLHNHLRGLSQVQAAQVLNAILPGGRGRVLLTEMTMLDRLKSKYEQINKTAGGFGGSVRAQQNDPQTKLHEATARIQADMVRLGNVLGPIVMPAVTALVNVGAKLLEWLTALPKAIKDVISWFSNAGGAVGGFKSAASSAFGTIMHAASSLWSGIKTAFGQIATAAKHVFGGEVGRDLLAIGKVFLGFGAIVFKVISKIVTGVLPGLVSIVKGSFNAIAGAIKLITGLLTLDFGKAWSGVKQIFGGAIAAVEGLFQGLWGGIKAIGGTILTALEFPFVTAFNFIKGVVTTGINWIIDAINSMINAFNSVAGSIPFIGGALTIGTIAHVGGGGGSPGNSPVGPPILPSPNAFGHAALGGSGGKVHKNIARAGAALMSGAQAATATADSAAVGGGWNHGDIVVKVGEREFGRVQRRAIVNAMAAGA